jgi:hypothetical protein
MHSEILLPLVALMAWTMIMWFWMYATRIPAMQKLQIEPDALVRQGAPGLDALLPATVQWKAQNYNHLHEAPTVFYAVGLVLAVMGMGNGTPALLAWIYVALRVAHSLVQATVNRVMLRFFIFALSSIVLMSLVGWAAFGAVTTAS